MAIKYHHCQRAALWAALLEIAFISACGESALADSPLDNATAVWHFSRKDDAFLTKHGAVKTAVALEGPARGASLVRGGDGRVARFAGGYLQTNTKEPIELTGKQSTIYLRVKDASGQWNSGLLAKASPRERYSNILYGDGQDVFYLWRTSPAWKRVEGIPAPKDEVGKADAIGTYGFNGEANDAHDLLKYSTGRWQFSLVQLAEDATVTVADPGHANTRKFDIAAQHIAADAFHVGTKHNLSEIFAGDIAEILVYDRALDTKARGQLFQYLTAKWGGKGLGKPDTALPREGLVLRLDASQTPAQDDGRVSRWPDLSGRGNHMLQSDEAKCPKLVKNTAGGLPIVRFNGHQFLKGPPVLREGDDSFAIVAVWRRDHGNGSQVICEQAGTEVKTGARAALLAQGTTLARVHPMARNRLFADGVLTVSAPCDWIGRDRWHDVVACFSGPIIELYVDGVLIDEQWPHGALDRFRSPFLFGAKYENGEIKPGFRGDIDHVALWNRALSQEEIVALSGGAAEVARRDLAILGKRQKRLQYWKPRGKAYAGDCMVTCQDGEFHVYYLYDRLHHAAKWGLGAHQYGHFSTRDLKTWTHHPLAVPIDKQWECAMGTGNIIYNVKDKKWYAFYTDCGSRIQFFDKPQRGAWLFRSVSDDGIHFTKDFKPVLPGFDSDIFYVPKTGLFHLIAEGGRTHHQSKDLQEWSEVKDSEFRKTAERDQLSVICPDTLAWNGWYYFTTGSSSIYKSRSPLGPWEAISKNIFDGLCFSKMHEFKDGRALAAGWVNWPGWGGNIVVRELVQDDNGNLGLKFVPEMVPASGPALSLQIDEKKGDVSGDFKQLRLRAGNSLSYVAVDNVPYDVRIRLRVDPSEDIEAFGVCLRGAGDYGEGNELSFRLAQRHVQFAYPQEGGLGNMEPVRLIMNGDTGAMPPVTGLDKPFTIEIVTKGRILDVCIDDRRTFVARRTGQGGKRLFFFARGGEVVFEQIEIRPLTAE